MLLIRLLHGIFDREKRAVAVMNEFQRVHLAAFIGCLAIAPGPVILVLNGFDLVRLFLGKLQLLTLAQESLYAVRGIVVIRAVWGLRRRLHQAFELSFRRR